MHGAPLRPLRDNPMGIQIRTRKGATMIRLASILVASLTHLPGTLHAETDCTAVLTGKWASKGDFKMGPITTKVDNLFTLNADATFETDQKYLGQDGVWQQQALKGKWSARPGKTTSECVIEMSAKAEFGSSSSSTTVTIVDHDTYRSWGMDSKRVK
jgi:hypothetical protein